MEVILKWGGRLISWTTIIATLWLLRYLLAIPSIPLNPHYGWRAFMGWFLIATLVDALRCEIRRRCTPAPYSRGPDPYTQVIAEMEAEKALRAAQDGTHPGASNAAGAPIHTGFSA